MLGTFGGALEARQIDASDGKLPEEDQRLSIASDTEAYAGHLVKARELTHRSLDSAIHNDSKETGAIWQNVMFEPSLISQPSTKAFRHFFPPELLDQVANVQVRKPSSNCL